MYETNKTLNFLSQLVSFFPETLQYSDTAPSNGNHKDNIARTLNRHILYINNVPNLSRNLPDGVHEYNILENDTMKESEANKVILLDLLEILNANLGTTYEVVSHTIYENKRPWKANKWDEMLTPDLIYISYWEEGADGTKCEPLLYLSFMLTEETDVSAVALTELVVYLYEIQLLPCVRGQGMGQKLIGYLKSACRSYNKFESINCNITSIVLTVFSSNEGALRFYQRLGFRFTAASPRDEKITSVASRTRGRVTESSKVGNSALQSVRGNQYQVVKPVYYLLYLLLE